MRAVRDAKAPSAGTATVARIWRDNGVRRSTIRVYLYWVRRFEADCAVRGFDSVSRLTLVEATAFARRYSRRRGVPFRTALVSARPALYGWSWALSALGQAVPEWKEKNAHRAQAHRSPVLAEFIHHRIEHRGIAPTTAVREQDDVAAFCNFLRGEGRSMRRIRLEDLDAFVALRGKRYAMKTVARTCSTIRVFLRFLHLTGRLSTDLAASVSVPQVRKRDHPPRALPWSDVRRILHAIDRTKRTGQRDYALLLVMATYGMGASEALRLRLEDIDWKGGILHVVRPKTGVGIELPLLAPVAQALIPYLRHGRPRHTRARCLFVGMRAPHGALSGSSAVRHILVQHARAAGVSAPFLGSHALRHSHASRQVDLGITPKVLSDILGHRRPDSTSAYVRIAVQRLREIALAVPR